MTRFLTRLDSVDARPLYFCGRKNTRHIMKAKKVYSAPAIEVMPLIVNSVLMGSDPTRKSGSLYDAYYWDPTKVDGDGYNVWE